MHYYIISIVFIYNYAPVLDLRVTAVNPLLNTAAVLHFKH